MKEINNSSIFLVKDNPSIDSYNLFVSNQILGDYLIEKDIAFEEQYKPAMKPDTDGVFRDELICFVQRTEESIPNILDLTFVSEPNLNFNNRRLKVRLCSKLKNAEVAIIQTYELGYQDSFEQRATSWQPIKTITTKQNNYSMSDNRNYIAKSAMTENNGIQGCHLRVNGTFEGRPVGMDSEYPIKVIKSIDEDSGIHYLVEVWCEEIIVDNPPHDSVLEKDFIFCERAVVEGFNFNYDLIVHIKQSGNNGCTTITTFENNGEFQEMPVEDPIGD
ncbi:MAG: hypothetical protein AAFP19_18545 [Bacteroidota bacterium]